MMKTMIAALMASAVLGVPGIALADDAMGHGAMDAAPSKMATMVCRPAAAGEKPSAMMTGAEKTALVCKSIKPEMMMKKGAGPDLSRALSADQADAAWREFLQSAVAIPGGTGGG